MKVGENKEIIPSKGLDNFSVWAEPLAEELQIKWTYGGKVLYVCVREEEETSVMTVLDDRRQVKTSGIDYTSPSLLLPHHAMEMVRSTQRRPYTLHVSENMWTVDMF